MQNLQKLRTNNGLSQKQLAELSGINLRVIQHYEQGSRNLNHARIDTIMRLAIALDCKIMDLIDNAEFLELIKKVEFK